MRKISRFALVMAAVMLMATLVGAAQAVPPDPVPHYQGNGWCWAWDGHTYTLVAGGQVVGYLFTGYIYLPVCPMGPENFDYSDSVQGTFVENTELLQWPDATQGIGVVMEIGKTVWVHGIDSTGSFFQISVGASKAWVPVSSLSPNYDKVWDGAPLVVPVVD